MKQILQTSEFWDCECESDYIHHRSKMICSKCFSRRDEQPDSTLCEVIEMLINKVYEDN